jgi:hypothetical protein
MFERSVVVLSIFVVLVTTSLRQSSAFSPLSTRHHHHYFQIHHGIELYAKKAVGGGGFGASKSSASPKKAKKKKNSLADTLEDKPNPRKVAASANMPFVKSEQEDLLEQLAAKAQNTCIGRVVASSPLPPDEIDPFWQLMPSLVSSRFPDVSDKQLERIAGVVAHALNPNFPLDDDIINDPMRPHEEIHAYMPGLGPTKPFYDPAQLELCKKLSENYETIKAEYHALLDDKMDRFQSVTSMNYESGWKTLVLFYNGHRIDGFPYHRESE